MANDTISYILRGSVYCSGCRREFSKDCMTKSGFENTLRRQGWARIKSCWYCRECLDKGLHK